MTPGIESIPFAKLKLSPLNPRKSIDPEETRALAASIEAEGLLENLVARANGKGYELIAGERRYRAIENIIARGKWPGVTDIPVRVVDCDDAQLIALALTENLQRKDLHPLDEAAAYGSLREAGKTNTEIAALVPFSKRHVELRLQLVDNLSATTQKAFRKGELDLARARVIAAYCPKKQQADVVRNIADENWGYENATKLRRRLSDALVPFGYAFFDLEAYDGAVIEDPDAEPDDDGETRYFGDLAQFDRLQAAAVEAKRAELEKVWSWVRVIDRRQEPNGLHAHQCSKSKDKKKAGAIIEIFDAGDVAIMDGLLLPATEKQRQAARTAKVEDKPPPMDPLAGQVPTTAGLERAKVARTEALREAVIANGVRAGMVCACLGLLGETGAVKLGPKDRSYNARDNQPSPAVALALNPRLAKIPGAGKRGGRYGVDFPGDNVKVLEGLLALAPAELEALFVALVANQVGDYCGHKSDLGSDAIPTRLAAEFGADLAKLKGWSLEEPDLEALRKPALARLIRDLGHQATAPELLKLKAGDLKQLALDRLAEQKAASKKSGAAPFVPIPYRFGRKKDLERKLKS